MIGYITIILGVVLLPIVYIVTMQIYKPYFREEENRTKEIFKSKEEIIVMIGSEVALVRIWIALDRIAFYDLKFLLLFFLLAVISILCITDYWEKIVPNRILLFWCMIYILVIGFYGLYNMDRLLKELPYMVLGFVFCLLAFGIGYVLGHGSMGAGDVKLSLVMGLFMTSEYVVGAVFYGCIISAFFSLIQLLRKRISRKDTIPFVPFLYLGVIIRYLIG